MFGYGEPGPQRIQEYKEISEMIRNFISKQFLENSDEKIDPFRTMFNHEEMITINSVSFLKTDLATTEFLFELAKKAKETASDFLPIIAAHPNVNDEIICYLLSDSEKHEAWGNLLKRKDITKNQVRILASIENKFGCTGLVYIAGSRFVNDFLDQISNQFNLSSFEKLLVKKKENYIRVGCFGDVVGNLFSNEVVSNEFL